MKKYLVLFTSAILFSMSVFLPSAIASGESAGAPPWPGPGYLGIDADPAFEISKGNPALSGRLADAFGNVSAVANCASLEDPDCSKMNVFAADSLFPLCISDTDTNCVEGLTAIDTSGKALASNYGQKFPGVRPNDYVGDPSKKLPSGGQAPVVEIPGAPHEGGTKYMVLVNPRGIMDLRNPSTPKEFSFQFQTAIFAFKEITGTFTILGASDRLADYTSWGSKGFVTGVGGRGDKQFDCLINDTNRCAVAQEMPLDITFKLKVRTNYSLVNWYSGRLSDPIVEVVNRSTGDQLITISGKPSTVPRSSKWVKKTELPKAVNDFYEKLPKPLGGSGDWSSEKQAGDPSTWTLMRPLTDYSQERMDEYLVWLPVINDKADYLPTYWTVSSMGTGFNPNPCLKSTKDVIGIVSTNATQFLEGPPVFNAATSTLEYKVAAPHYKPNGEVFKGTYDLQLRSESARCLYNFSKAPISAKVEVLSENGEKQVAVTTVNEKDGWLYLSAKGFTFSAPVVSVKLSQEKPVVVPTPSPTPTPTMAPVAAKKSSITCVKGKTSKKVTAINPKCPTGYKKK
jgi:hypothetical protein